MEFTFERERKPVSVIQPVALQDERFCCRLYLAQHELSQGSMSGIPNMQPAHPGMHAGSGPDSQGSPLPLLYSTCAMPAVPQQQPPGKVVPATPDCADTSRALRRRHNPCLNVLYSIHTKARAVPHAYPTGHPASDENPCTCIPCPLDSHPTHKHPALPRPLSPSLASLRRRPRRLPVHRRCLWPFRRTTPRTIRCSWLPHTHPCYPALPIRPAFPLLLPATRHALRSSCRRPVMRPSARLLPPLLPRLLLPLLLLPRSCCWRGRCGSCGCQGLGRGRRGPRG